MITRLVIEIDTTTDAFVKDIGGEIERIFSDIRVKINGGDFKLRYAHPILDTNGNDVGFFVVERQ